MVNVLEKIREEFGEKCASELEKILGENLEIEANEDTMETLYFFGKIFSSRLKATIFALLIKYELPVCAISAILDKDQTLISHYLTELKHLGILIERRVGKFRFYRVDIEKIREKFKILEELLGV